MDNLKQFIADIYHCSDCWGIKVTEGDMHINLTEWNQEMGPDEYCPSPEYARECADYWNELCDAYPA